MLKVLFSQLYVAGIAACIGALLYTLFAIIGFITVIVLIVNAVRGKGRGKKKEETPGEYWRRTGRLKD